MDEKHSSVEDGIERLLRRWGALKAQRGEYSAHHLLEGAERRSSATADRQYRAFRRRGQCLVRSRQIDDRPAPKPTASSPAPRP